MTSTPPQLPTVENDPETSRGSEVSPRGQEVEYALVLSRIIDEVKSDPAQLRWAIYEVARARLKIDSAWLDRPERARLAEALETAIEGVESFSARNDGAPQLAPPPSLGLSGPKDPDLEFSARRGYAPGDDFKGRPGEIDVTPTVSTISARGKRGAPPKWLWVAIAAALTLPVVGLVLARQQVSWLGSSAKLSPQTDVAPPQPGSNAGPQAAGSRADDPRAVGPGAGRAGIPLPTVYGVYALNNGGLSELDALAEQVPDKRVAMSTPVTKPSNTSLADGKVSFVVYRRDMAENAPDRVDVRVVARVTRALTFGPKGQGSFAAVNDAWNIRNIAFQFRVRPVPGAPEMLLVQSEKSEFALPPGRYVLVLKNQGYDFTVAGTITDPSQCVERTEAANGIFFSECQRK